MKLAIPLAAALACLCAASPASAGGDAEAGKTKSQACASCHGPDGNSPNPPFPKLAGQHADYLQQALRDYRSGERKNAVMSGFASSLSDQDIEDLAAYYAAQNAVLFTPTRY